MNIFAKSLLVAFSSEYTFYQKAQNYHWNVEGYRFTTLHPFFGDIYTDVYADIDAYAENIRALRIKIPSNLNSISALKFDDMGGEMTADEMIESLLHDSIKLTNMFKTLIHMAGDNGEFGVHDFLIKRMAAHRKYEWMLRSILVD